MAKLYIYKTIGKLQKRSLIFILLLLGSNLIVSNSLNMLTITYNMLLLIPLFLTTDVISEVYTHHREGLLFTTKTPIYKQMVIRYLVRFIIGIGSIAIIFIIGLISGIEEYPYMLVVLIIYSFFISLIGVTLANTSKNTYVGYGLSFIYWGSCSFLVGFKENESILRPFSVVLNLYTREKFYFDNILYILLFSAILILFNLYYISKGEGIRKGIKIIALVGAIIICILFINNQYIRYKKNYLQNNIIKDEKTIYIMMSNNLMIKNYLNENKITYITEFNEEDLKGSNIVLIKDSEIIEPFEYNKQIEIIDNAICIDGVTIKDTNAYKMIRKNPVDNNKYMIVLEGTGWQANQIDILLKNQSHFMALKEDKILASLSHIKDDNINVNDLKLSNSTWLTVKDCNVILQYRGFSKEHAMILLNDWGIVFRLLKEEFPKLEIPNKLQTCYYDDNTTINTELPIYKLVNIRDFEPTKYSGRPILYRMMLEVIYSEVLNNITDSQIKEKMAENIYNINIARKLYENLPVKEKQYSQLYNVIDLKKYTNDRIKNYENKNLTINKTSIILDFLFVKIEENNINILEIINESHNNIGLNEFSNIIKSVTNNKAILKILQEYNNNREAMKSEKGGVLYIERY